MSEPEKKNQTCFCDNLLMAKITNYFYPNEHIFGQHFIRIHIILIDFILQLYDFNY